MQDLDNRRANQPGYTDPSFHIQMHEVVQHKASRLCAPEWQPGVTTKVHKLESLCSRVLLLCRQAEAPGAPPCPSMAPPPHTALARPACMAWVRAALRGAAAACADAGSQHADAWAPDPSAGAAGPTEPPHPRPLRSTPQHTPPTAHTPPFQQHCDPGHGNLGRPPTLSPRWLFKVL